MLRRNGRLCLFLSLFSLQKNFQLKKNNNYIIAKHKKQQGIEGEMIPLDEILEDNVS